MEVMETTCNNLNGGHEDRTTQGVACCVLRVARCSHSATSTLVPCVACCVLRCRYARLERQARCEARQEQCDDERDGCAASSALCLALPDGQRTWG